MLNWAAWMRMHARDPMWRPDVITAGGYSEMVWDRWNGQSRHDVGWSVEIIDSKDEAVATTAERVLNWIVQAKAHMGT